jgi:hypothetical protein
MRCKFERVDLGAIFTAELAAVIAHEIEMARLRAECDRIVALRQRDALEGDD